MTVCFFRLLNDLNLFSTPFLFIEFAIHSSSSSFRYFRNLVVEYVVNIADESIQADPTKCLLLAKADIKVGAAAVENDGDALATTVAVVENAADADEDEASVAIDE